MKRLSMAETCKILGISNSSLLRYRKNDENFPHAQKKNKKEIFFIEDEILEWKKQYAY